MAKYEISSPSGDLYEVEAPDNATEEQVLNYFKSQITPQDAIQKPSGTSFGEEVSQLGPAFIESLGRPLESMGETFDVFGFKGVASALKGAITEPENYISASQRFTEPSPEDSQFLGFAWQYAPRAAVEQAGQALGSMVTGIAGRAVGGLAGAPAGPAGSAIGQAVGAFLGPAIFEAAQIIGPIAKDRAKNNGREVPTNEDILAATVAATGSGALNAIGAKYLPGGEKATGKFFKRVASSFIGEGLTEAPQSIVEQIGSTAGTEAGLNINYKQALAEGLIGGVTGAGLTGITAPFSKQVEDQVIKTPEQAEEIDIDSKANEEALSLIGAPADQAKNDQIVKIKELESVIATNEVLSEALEPNTPEAQRIDLENKVARNEIEKYKVELEKSVGLTPVEDVKTIQKRIDDSKIQLTGLEPTSRKAKSIEAQIAQDEARIKALSKPVTDVEQQQIDLAKQIAAPAPEIPAALVEVAPEVEPAPIQPAAAEPVPVEAAPVEPVTPPVEESPTPAVTEKPSPKKIETIEDIEAGAPPLSTKNLYFENNLAQRAWRIAAGFKYDKERGDWFHPNYPNLSRGNAEQEITDTNPPTQTQVRAVLDQLRQKYTPTTTEAASTEAPSFTEGDMVRVPNRVPVYEKGEVVGGKTVMVGGSVTRVMPDGKVEVRLQQGGYATLNPSDIELRRKAATPAVTKEAPAPTEAVAPAPATNEAVKFADDALKDRDKEVTRYKKKAESERKSGREEMAQRYEGMIADLMSIPADQFKQDVIDNPAYYIESNIDPFLRYKNKEINRAIEPTTQPPAAPEGISVGNRIKLGKSPQTYIVEEVMPQSASEKELGEQYYSVKNERTGETQVVEEKDLKKVGGKRVRRMAVTSQQDAEYLRLAKDPEKNREQLQRMVDEAAKKAGVESDAITRRRKTILDLEKEEQALWDAQSAPLVTKADFLSGARLDAIQKQDIARQNVMNSDRYKEIISAKNSIYAAIKKLKNKPQDFPLVTYDDAGNVIPLSQRFQTTSPDIRKMESEPRVEEKVTPVPEKDRYTFEEAVKEVDAHFGKQGIPEGIVIVNNTTEPELEMKAGYFVNRNQIVINLAYISKDANIGDIINHELGHYIFSDPKFQDDFKQFWELMTPDEMAEADRIISNFYNKETGAVQIEEKQVRAFMQLIQDSRAMPKWRQILDSIKRWINDKFGTNLQVTDRGALAVLAAAHKRFKSGEKIIRNMDGVLKMAARSKDTEESIKNAKQIEEITKKTLLNLGAEVSRDYNAFVNDGKSEEQIASQNNTSVNQVRNNILKGRKAIGEALKNANINTNQKPENMVVEWTKGAAKKYFTKEGNLPGGTFQNWIRRNAKISKEAEEVRQSIQDLYDGLRKKYNINKIEYILNGLSSVPPDDVAKINDALAGEIPIYEMPVEIQGPITRMRQHIDAMSSELIATGQLPEYLEAKAINNLGVYLTRSYKIFTDPKWINKIPQDKLTAARNFLYQQEIKRNPEFTIEDAERKLQQMLNDWQGEKDSEGKRGGRLGAKDLSVMMTRSDIPKQLRDVMGENTNVIFNYANTISKISRFVADQKFLDAVKKEGSGKFLYTKDNAPSGFNTLIAPEESRTMSPLSGLRTSPEIAKAFEEFGKAYDASANPFLYMLGWLNAVGKANLTVGSILTQMRNIIGQPFFFLSNGHTDIGLINKEVESIMKSNGLNKEQARNELVKMAAGEGLVGENAYAGEMREAFDQIGLKTFEDMEADEFSRQFIALRLFRKGTQGAQNIYQKTDEVGKMIGWLNETKRIQKMNPQISKEDAMAIASERVRNTYPTYSQSSEAIRLFRRQPFFGPFATFFYETFRTTYWNLKYAFDDINSGTKEGKAEGIKRLAGTMAQISTGAFLVNTLSALAAGVGDKEEEDVRRMLPPWAQDASLFWFPKTKDGVYDFINFSYINPYNAISDPFVAMMSGFSRGEDPVEIFAKAAASFLSPFTSEQPVSGAMIDTLRNVTETGTKIYNVEDDLGTKTSKILLHIFGKAFTPGTIDRLRKRIIPALYGETVGTRAPAPLKEIGAELTGIRFENLDMRSAFQSKAWEFSRAQNDSERIFRDVATRRRRVTEEEQIDAYRKSEQSRFDNWQEMYRNYMAVRRAGASAEEAVRLMTDIKISKKEAALIAKGMYRPYEVSDEVKRRSRINGNTIPIEQINQIRQSMPKVLEDVK